MDYLDILSKINLKTIKTDNIRKKDIIFLAKEDFNNVLKLQTDVMVIRNKDISIYVV